jgi:hypothetical protein
MRFGLLPIFAFLAISAPAHSQEREWKLDITDQDAFLVFGTPETDDVGLGFWCKLASNKIKLYVPNTGLKLKKGATTKIRFEMAGKHYDLRGSSAADETFTKAIEVQFNVDDKLLKRLLDTDYISIRIGKKELNVPVMDADIEGLLKICRGTS